MFELGTHGVFVLKDGDHVWGFHILEDGYEIEDFYKIVKDIKHFPDIFTIALVHFTDKYSSEYNDEPKFNFYREKFDPEVDYSNITDYTLYFDGQYKYNWDD